MMSLSCMEMQLEQWVLIKGKNCKILKFTHPLLLEIFLFNF